MNRTMVFAMVGVVAISVAGFAQTAAPALPDNWQSLSVGELSSLAGKLQTGGKPADANMVLEYAATKVATVQDCRWMATASGQVKGQSSQSFLAGVLAGRCMADFGKCTVPNAGWGADLLVAQGKTTEAGQALDAAAPRCAVLTDWRSMEKTIKAVKGAQADAYSAQLISDKCMADFAKCSTFDGEGAIRLLAAQGKNDQAKQALNTFGPRIELLAMWNRCRGYATKVMTADELAAWTKNTASSVHITDLDQVGTSHTLVLLQQLASAGRTDVGVATLTSVGKGVKSVADCYSLKDAAKGILGADADKFLAGLVVGVASTPGNATNDAKGWAVDLLSSQGKTDAAKQALDSLGQTTSDTKSFSVAYAKAKTMMSADEAAKWLSDLYTARCASGLNTVESATGVTALFVSEKRPVEANAALAAIGKTVKTVGMCKQLLPAATTVLGSKAADDWAYGIVLNQTQDDWDKCDRYNGGWAIGLLAGKGKTAEARKILDSMAGKVSTVAEWRGVATAAKPVLGDGAGAWCADLLFQKAIADLATCDMADGITALDILVAASQNDKAKTVLDKLGARVKTVGDCQKLAFQSGRVMGAKSDDWLAGILLGNCKDDFPKCDAKQGAWAAQVLKKVGKTAEAKALLDSLKAKVSAVGQTRQMAQQIQSNKPQADVMKWAADVLQNNCQDDLKQCGLGDAGWAAWVLAKAGQKDQATAVLASIEAGERTPSPSIAGMIDDDRAVARAYWSLAAKDKAQQWMMKAYLATVGSEEARSMADERTLSDLSYAMSGFDMIGKGKGYPAFAAALAGLAAQGQLDGPYVSYMFLGQPLGTPDSQQILHAQLTDANSGLPRLAATKILGWAYRTSGDLDKWTKSTEDNIAASGGQPDAKAMWLVARAHAESLVPMEPSPLRGKKWLDDALATAASASVRLVALREIVQGYAEIDMHDTALSLMDSVAGQFAGADAAAGFAALRGQVAGAKAAYAASLARSAGERQRQAVDAWRAEVQRRLDSAKAAGDAESAARLAQLLGNG